MPVRQETGVISPVAGPTIEPSYLGPDTAFEGNIVCDGEIHINCEFRGSIQAGTCLVDVSGQVHGSISAQFVVVRGRVLGPITAQQLTIAKGAHVEGNVLHRGISIEQGAFVMGTITQEMERQPLPEISPVALADESHILPALPSKK